MRNLFFLLVFYSGDSKTEPRFLSLHAGCGADCLGIYYLGPWDGDVGSLSSSVRPLFSTAAPCNRTELSASGERSWRFLSFQPFPSLLVSIAGLSKLRKAGFVHECMSQERAVNEYVKNYLSLDSGLGRE